MSEVSPRRITREDLTVKRDDVALRCRLSLPEAPAPMLYVVFVHGLGSSKESPRNLIVSERLLDAGIATVLFDLSGHGESSSDPEERFAQDLQAVCQWAETRRELDVRRMGIAGSSLGAVVALDAVQRRYVSPATLVLRAPPIKADQLADVRIPTLIVVGTDDVLLEQVRSATAGREHVTVETVAGASHLFEEPGTLEKAVELTARWFADRLTA